MSKPMEEALKEIGRWLICLVVGWVITQTLNQVTVIPESHTITVWLFHYVIPVRLIVQTLLTLAGRAIDKYIFARNKEILAAKTTLVSTVPKGLIWF